MKTSKFLPLDAELTAPVTTVDEYYTTRPEIRQIHTRFMNLLLRLGTRRGRATLSGLDGVVRVALAEECEEEIHDSVTKSV